MEELSPIPIQKYTVKELAKRYGCSPKTVKAWLKGIEADVGPRIGNYYTPRQVQIILDKLGNNELYISNVMHLPK